MSHSIREIARLTGLEAAGALDLTVTGAAEPGDAGADDLALAMAPDFAAKLGGCAARAAVLWPDADWKALGFEAALFAPRPRMALAGITAAFAAPLDLDPGIHPTALIDPDARLGADVWVGPFTTVSAGAEIGEGVRICGQVTVGPGVRIGAQSVLRPGTRIGGRVSIGARVSIHPNVCIGADGFSYVTPERGSVEAAKREGALNEQTRNLVIRRIASLGAVTIGDDVEIGAGTCIDRGTISDTTIGAGTKIDDLVMIGHNVQVGENCMLCGQVGIAGSTRLGDRVVMGGQVGVADHLTIGSDAVVAGGSLIGTDLPAGGVYMGAPAAPKAQVIEQFMAIKRLPRIVKQVRDLSRKVGL